MDGVDVSRVPIEVNRCMMPKGDTKEPRVEGASARVIVIEDDAEVALVIKEGLVANGFSVTHAPTIGQGRSMLADSEWDVIVLDLMLPDGSGLELANSLRRSGNETPILMLTARDTVEQRVEGFRQGADDYLCKPFDVDELSARLGAIVRRARTSDRQKLRYADIELDLLTRKVTRNGSELTLSARETELLAFMMRHPQEILPRERILRQVWGDEAEDDSNVLNVYVNYLRNKVEGSQHARIIHTVRGTGYMLSELEPDALHDQGRA